MSRRNTRLRREYLYRKSLEGKDKAVYEKKKLVKQALAEGRPIPTELKAEHANLSSEIQLEDAVTSEVKSMIDDEYAKAGISDPKILVTTARDPSSRLTQFAKELRLCFPNSTRINRGNTIIKEIVSTARGDGITDIIIVHEHRGEPDGLIVSHMPFGPTAYFGLTNCVLRHDIKDQLDTISEAAPHLIFHNFQSSLGRRLQNVLKFLYPVPKEDSRRVMSFINRNDSISFRHHVYKKTGHKEVELAEVGPRFELKLYQIKLGSVEMAEADNEWVLRPYMTTAKKRKAL